LEGIRLHQKAEDGETAGKWLKVLKQAASPGSAHALRFTSHEQGDTQKPSCIQNICFQDENVSISSQHGKLGFACQDLLRFSLIPTAANRFKFEDQ